MGIQFNGRLFAKQKLTSVASQVTSWSLRSGRAPKIVSIFPFEDHASVMYTKLKKKDAESVGIQYEVQPLSLRAPREDWLKAVHQAARNKKTDGILVQKPSADRFLEVHRGEYEQFSNWWSGIAESIPVEKDVDCLAPLSLFRLEQRAEQVGEGKHAQYDSLSTFILPATAQAVVDIALDLSWRLEELRKKRVVVIGRSVIVGKPAAAALRLLGVECALVSSKSNLDTLLPEADVVVSASGRSNFIKAEWIKAGSILIDVGAPVSEFESGCYDKASAWTPVPGGVGPVTRACLLENLFKLPSMAQNRISGK